MAIQMTAGRDDDLLRHLGYCLIELRSKTGYCGPETQTMDDSVQIHCHRCKSSFRDKARRLQSGYSRQCVSCETMLFFDDDSNDKNIRRTLREAKRVRKALREAEAEQVTSKPFVSTARGSSETRSTTSGREN